MSHRGETDVLCLRPKRRPFRVRGGSPDDMRSGAEVEWPRLIISSSQLLHL